MDNPIHALARLGQSIWYDNIERGLLESGELAAMIDRGDIRGVTSNPSIFQAAIAGSTEYDGDLQRQKGGQLSPIQLYEYLAIADIQAAADLFRPLYERTEGGDGYVSLEVNPHLAYDTAKTVQEAQRLWETVQRPNLMVKIPATEAGVPAIRDAIHKGLNINVTLIFSLERYLQVLDAYYSGLEDRLADGLPVASIASVASFFVSRVDSKVDTRLNGLIKAEAESAGLALQLLGKIAVANARLAYGLFKDSIGSRRFLQLAQEGAKVQRPLWASTSTKNPKYSDVKYVEELVAADTVNTIPPATLLAFKDHGVARFSIEENIDSAREEIASLQEAGISLEEVTAELETEGVRAFADAFDGLIATIEDRVS